MKKQDELLKYAVENGMIDLSYVQEQIEMNKRKELLEKHPYKIWNGKDGKWYTYLADEEKGRILKKRNSEKSIQDCIIDYYLEIEQHPCFREVYKQWIDEKEEFAEIGKNSITRYENAFSKFFPSSEPFCKIRMCDMTDSELEKFIKRMIHDNNLTEKSYTMLRLIIIGVFKFAKREKYTNYSISTFFRDVSLPSNIFTKKIKEKSKEVFNENEISLLLKYFWDNQTIINLGLILAFYSGMRVGELSSLKKNDIIGDNLIRVCRTEINYIDRSTNQRIFMVKEYPKTDNSIRDIIVPEDAKKVLYILKNMNQDEYIFMESGKRIREARFNYYLKKACNEVGILPRSTHKIRKTYGSKLLSGNVDETIVAQQMGHKDISTTKSYYYFDISTDKNRINQINSVVRYKK